jgi:hypothetical protein
MQRVGGRADARGRRGRACASIGVVALLAHAACASDDTVQVSVGPSLLFPRALLDNVNKLTLKVYEANGGADCDAATSSVTLTTDAPIATKDLGKSCANGAAWCGELTILQSGDDRVFAAAGFSGSGEQIAVGCTKGKVNQDALPISIKMRRFVKPAVCNNGAVEPTEQCEGGAVDDPLCDEKCHSKEILLSNGKGGTGKTANGRPGDKTRPFMLWPAQTGDAGRFLAFFGDRTPSLTEVTMRVLDDSMKRYDKQGAELADFSFFLPNSTTAGFPPAASPNNQSSPVAAAISSKYYVAFEDDSSGTVDVRLRSMDTTLTALENSPLTINGTATGEPGVQSLPTMATNASGLLFIAWQDESSGAVRGRTFDPTKGATGALGQQREISTGANNKRVQIASNGSGWIAVWESGQDVKARAIGADGTPLATEQKVNDATHGGVQAHPSVAGLPDGRFAIAWNDRGSTDVFVQRYGADTRPIGGDQTTHVNDVVFEGDQTAPFIASGPQAGGSYAVAWVDGASGHVRARLLGGTSGFLFNSVDAQSGEFQASVADGRTRANPTVAVGGSGPFLAIGWEDTTAAATSGIYARRFPVPN